MTQKQSPESFEAGYRWLLCLNCSKPHTFFAHSVQDAPIITCGCGFRSRFARGFVLALDAAKPNTNDPARWQALNQKFGYLEEA